MVERVLQAGADADLCAGAECAIDAAVAGGNVEVLTFLLDAGATVGNATPTASGINRSEILRILRNARQS